MKLFDHQKKGIEFLKEKERAILADEMGLGKTIQAIRAVKGLGATLVVCPASIKTNWEREIIQDNASAIVQILNGRQAKQEDGRPDWIIINYDIVSYRQKELIEAMKQGEIKNVILDEAHYIKGRSKRAIATLNITRQAERVYCLTGTPLLNRPIELWHFLVAIEHPLTEPSGARS